MNGAVRVGDRVYKSAAEAVRESGYRRTAIYNALSRGKPLGDGTPVAYVDKDPGEIYADDPVPQPLSEDAGSQDAARILAESIGHLFDGSVATDIVRGIAANVRLMAMESLERAARMERAADMIDSLKEDAGKAANPEPMEPAAEGIARAAEAVGGAGIAVRNPFRAPPVREGITARDLLQCTILIDDNEHPDTRSAADSIDADEDDLIAALVDGRTEFENHHIELGHEGLEESRRLIAA